MIRNCRGSCLRCNLCVFRCNTLRRSLSHCLCVIWYYPLGNSDAIKKQNHQCSTSTCLMGCLHPIRDSLWRKRMSRRSCTITFWLSIRGALKTLPEQEKSFWASYPELTALQEAVILAAASKKSDRTAKASHYISKWPASLSLPSSVVSSDGGW